MQQNIIGVPCRGLFGALAIAAALTLSAPACADNVNVTVYGQANVSYDMINTGTTSGTGSSAGISSSRVSSNSSRLGLKGSNELGSGWSALWQMEATAGTDTGASGGAGTPAGTTMRSARLFDRNTYLGLSHEDWGKVLAGRHDTPYKMSTRRLDVFADGIADNRSLMGTTVIGGVVTETFDVRVSNLIAYLSPNIGSFSVAVGYANLAESNTNASQDNVSAFSLAGMYEQDPVYMSFAYEAHTTTLKESSIAVKAAKLGLGYRMGILDLGFAYEKSSDDFGNAPSVTACAGMADHANCSGHGTMYLSAKLNITDADALKVAYSRAGQVGAASTLTGANQFSMGVDHDINERTTVYGLYTSLKNDKLAEYGLSSAASSGVYSVNTSGTGGASPSAFSFGLKHAF
ncbi:MAG TPA: porin [Gallionella sp.]